MEFVKKFYYNNIPKVCIENPVGYLNNNWNENYGGYFNYKEQKTNEIKTVIPQHNLMLVNRGNISHCVTPTISTAPIRKTIQFFLKQL